MQINQIRLQIAVQLYCRFEHLSISKSFDVAGEILEEEKKRTKKEENERKPF